MIKDFRDANKDIVTMFRNEDKTHDFYCIDANGISLDTSSRTFVCEVRSSSAQEFPSFNVDVQTLSDTDGIKFYRLSFSGSVISESIRENKLYWKVYSILNSKNTVIKYGEIWLKSN